MQLDFSDEQKALRDSLRRNPEKNCPISSVRAIIDSAAGHDVRQTRALAKDSGIVRPWMIIYKSGFKGGTGLITLTPQDVVKHQTMACHRFPADCVGCYIGVSGLQR
jgi:hypothetical protein